MRIAVIQFPGSNCERESALAVKRAGMEPVEFLWNEPEERLRQCDGYFIVGGFAYEDRSRAGIIASLDPVMGIIREEGEKGKPILGICNGAQVLVETGLVPGLENNRVVMALATNQRLKGGRVLGTGYYNVWANVQLAVPGDRTPFTRHLEQGEWIVIPIAHAQGRFMMPEELLEELNANNQTIFRYGDNPNGSMDNLAAVSNTKGNIMAMMPHPERTTAGDPIFTSMRDAIREGSQVSGTTLKFRPSDIYLTPYTAPANSFELLVDLVITDNESVSVENALRHLGISASVKREAHWEVVWEPGKDVHLKDQIVATGELFNSNKEELVDRNRRPGAVSFLVRYRDDIEGQHKRDALENWFHVEGIREIKKGTLWTIVPSNGTADEVLDAVIDTHILFNPYSHDCFRYG